MAAVCIVRGRKGKHTGVCQIAVQERVHRRATLAEPVLVNSEQFDRVIANASTSAEAGAAV